MPTNVPPQYRDAEERFRSANTVQAKIAALQEMLAIMPKHKGTDHLKAQLRSRMSRLMVELEGQARGPSTGRAEPFSMPKEGAGRASLIGLSNSGKSLLLSRATGAKTRVGNYALTTQEPVKGMFAYKDIHVQLVDTPPISNPRIQGQLYGLLRNSEVFVIMVDLTEDPVNHVKEIFHHLNQWDFKLLKQDPPLEQTSNSLEKPTIIVGNKADIHGALDHFQELEKEFANQYPLIMASAEEAVGLEELSQSIFLALKVIRVYTKSPRQKLDEFDKKDPLVLAQGSTVSDAAEQVHKDLGRGLKYAVLWGKSGKFQGQRVGKDHELTDEDVVEIH